MLPLLPEQASPHHHGRLFLLGIGVFPEGGRESNAGRSMNCGPLSFEEASARWLQGMGADASTSV
jgi:hypothetical protein